jgi:hypothetical protein
MLKNLTTIFMFSILSVFAATSFAQGNCGGSSADVIDELKQDKKDKEA